MMTNSNCTPGSAQESEDYGTDLSGPYYLLIGEQEIGPFSFQKLREMRETKQITSSVLYAQPGTNEWRPLADLWDLLSPATAGTGPGPAAPQQHPYIHPKPEAVAWWKAVDYQKVTVRLAVIAGLVLLWPLTLYFLPSIVGRKKKNSDAIMVLNLFLGWTFVGWVVALCWACMKDN
jgi:hypothetical protein